MMVHLRVAVFCGFISFLPGVLAGFNPGASDNIAVYWGQNSINRADGGQQRLATYCANTPVNIIPIAFLIAIKNPTSVNFANAGDNCTTFPGTQLLSCPQIEEDIQTCQSLNKTILLSLGGATYTEGGFASPDEATTWAAKLWAMFGPPGPPPASPASDDPCACSDSSASEEEEEEALRPFGLASVDGFDMDFEASSAHMAPFAGALRRHMDAATAATGRRFLLSAAPQCPFPDVAMREMLEQVGFDFVSVQFYNNYCGAGSYPANFNFERWDRWAREESVKKGAKVLLGLPGSTTAAGSGYVSGEQLEAVVRHSKGFGSFGGVMVWDISQVYGNPGFLDSLVSALGGDLPGTTSTFTTASTITTTSTRTNPTTTATTTTTSTSTFVTRTSTKSLTITITVTPPSPTGSLVPHWGQCGGRDWTGSTQCEPPYTCVAVGEWWSHCA